MIKVKMFIIFMVINGSYAEEYESYKTKSDCISMSEFLAEKYGSEQKNYICKEVDVFLDKDDLTQTNSEAK